MTSPKYIGMDVHTESISIAVRNSAGKVVMERVIETKASVILQFFNVLSGELHVTFEEGTAAAWLYDLLKPHIARLLVCNPLVLTMMLAASRQLVGIALRVEAIIPFGDMSIILASGGSKSRALSIAS